MNCAINHKANFKGRCFKLLKGILISIILLFYIKVWHSFYKAYFGSMRLNITKENTNSQIISILI